MDYLVVVIKNLKMKYKEHIMKKLKEIEKE